MRRVQRWLLVVYLVAIHGLLALVLWKSDFVELAALRLGVPAPFRTEFPLHWLINLWVHRNIDAQVPDNAVVFIGDSVIEGVYVNGLARPAINYGVYGDTTLGVLRRLPSYQSLARAWAAVLLIGINDLDYRPAETIGPNYSKILEQLAGTRRVFAVGLPPVNPETKAFPTNDLLRTVNATIASLCAGRANCRYVDPWPAMIGSAGALRAELLGGDGEHLNAAGNRILLRVIEQALDADKP